MIHHDFLRNQYYTILPTYILNKCVYNYSKELDQQVPIAQSMRNTI